MTTAEKNPQFKAAVYRVGPRTLVPLVRASIENFTDPMTNQISLSRIDVRSMLKKVDPGDLPLSDQGLRFFLHEATHHASFANNVGNARAALAVSVCGRASIGAPPKSRADLWLAQRDDIVLRFYEVVIEPLVEGLALFAEHDIRWGKWPVASHPMLHLWSLFLFKKAGRAALEGITEQSRPHVGTFNVEMGRQIVENWINDYLMRARAGEYWVEQKARLLRQPLLGASGPAYLLGYLAVKRAYIVLRRASRIFFDSDLFLLLMLKYWFSDAQITDLLVRVQDAHVASVQETIGEFIERFQDMWDELYTRPGQIAVRLLSDLEKEGRSTHTVSLTEMLIRMRMAADSLNIFVPRFYKHRLVFRLGMIRANIFSNQERRTAIIRDSETNEEMFRCPIVQLADTGHFPGTVEIVRTYDGRLTVIVVLGGSGLIAVRDLFGDQWNEPDMIDLFDDLPSLEYVEASAKAYEPSVFAKRWEDEDFREGNEHIMNQAKELCISTYLQLVLPRAEKDRRTKVAETLGTAGFTTLFPVQTDLDELALLTLHFGGSGTSIDTVAKLLERSVEELISKLESFNARSQSTLGVDLFELNEGIATAAL